MSRADAAHYLTGLAAGLVLLDVYCFRMMCRRPRPGKFVAAGVVLAEPLALAALTLAVLA